MANIQILDINTEDEGVLQKLSSNEMVSIHGGIWPIVPLIALGVGAAAFGYAVGADDRRRATGR